MCLFFTPFLGESSQPRMAEAFSTSGICGPGFRAENRKAELLLSHTLHVWTTICRSIDPPGTTPGLIGSPMAVPWVAFGFWDALILHQSGSFVGKQLHNGATMGHPAWHSPRTTAEIHFVGGRVQCAMAPGLA